MRRQHITQSPNEDAIFRRNIRILEQTRTPAEEDAALQVLVAELDMDALEA